MRLIGLGWVLVQIALLLMGFPLVFAVLVMFARTQKGYATIVRLAAILIMAATVVFFASHFGQVFVLDLSAFSWIKPVMAGIEILMALYIVYAGVRSKSYLVCILALSQVSLSVWFEVTNGHHLHVTEAIYIDRLSLLMIAIIGIIGSLICIYAIEYMKDYHHHKPELKDRRGMFFAVLFVFLSAMFGLVICNDMLMMLFFWEITSFCSFLLIGYTKSREAVKNSFLALTINVFGGLCFTGGIVLLGINEGIADFNSLLNVGSASPVIQAAVFLIACAGLTKSAQLPFSRWLLGAMVAPTPTSAMLHSSTMVKAGVYLIIRLAPMLGGNAPGVTITLIGGLTFFITAILAIAQSDAKKILAYSTISNLGLIVACAGINTAESLWAAIMLIVFHAIAKSLLFLSVGSTEHQLGSRNVEDMDGLMGISFSLTILLIIGIAGMFVAPFGMLVSKWAAMKAFVDSGNILIVMLIAYGSTVTLFFWTKWMGKLIASVHRFAPTNYIMRIDEKVSLYSLAGMVIVVCAAHPVISSFMVIPYIHSNLHINFVSPIDPLASTIIIFMLLMLFVLPIILIPFYKKHRIKQTTHYLAGANTGDDESFYGGMGEIKQVQLRNWYMKNVINEHKILLLSYIVCSFTILGGLFITMGGFFL